jgi:hypothetical protein
LNPNRECIPPRLHTGEAFPPRKNLSGTGEGDFRNPLPNGTITPAAVPTFSAALQKPNGTAPRISNSWAKGKERILANEVPIHYAKTCQSTGSKNAVRQNSNTSSSEKTTPEVMFYFSGI